MAAGTCDGHDMDSCGLMRRTAVHFGGVRRVFYDAAHDADVAEAGAGKYLINFWCCCGVVGVWWAGGVKREKIAQLNN